MPPHALLYLVYYALLAVLAVFGIHRLVIAWLYLRYREVPARPALREDPPRVTIQLPIYNERNVVERLIDAAAMIDWPMDRLEIQVLDDSTDDTTQVAAASVGRWRARGLDIHLLHRADRVGYKAGALEAGLAQATGELVAIFDADFIPQPEFLNQTVPCFDKADVGMVQARWGHLNEEANLLTRLATVMLDGHFVLEHTARNRSGRFFNFNGTAGVWSLAAIRDAGGWQHDTVTEDLDLSYRAQLRGWRFVYLKDLVVPSELPSSMRGFKNQQHRWAKGSMQTARKLLWRVLSSDQPARVKLEALAHLTNNLAYPMVLLLGLLLPVVVLSRGRGGWSPLLALDLLVFLCATGSVAVFYGLALREAYTDWRGRLWRIPLVMALGVGLALNQTRAVIEGLVSRDATFVRTPKRGEIGRRAMALRRYEPAAGFTPWFELLVGAWLCAGLAEIVNQGYYLSVPFLSLFCVGTVYVGLASLRGTRDAAVSPAPRPAPKVSGAVTVSQGE